jgi:acyl-CoA thioester hydrolase
MHPSEPDCQESLVGDAQLTYRGTVYPWHCDHMGHMNVMWYVGKFDEATWQFFTLLGLTPTALRAQQRGMAAVEQTIQYKRELHAGDVVSIHSQLLAVGDKSLRFRHDMIDQADGVLAATTTLVGVHLDTVAGRACALPATVATAARSLLAISPR